MRFDGWQQSSDNITISLLLVIDHVDGFGVGVPGLPLELGPKWDPETPFPPLFCNGGGSVRARG